MFLIRISAATSDDVAPAATTMGSAIMASEARMALCYRLLGRLVTGLDILLESVHGERRFPLGDGPDVHEARPFFGPTRNCLLGLSGHHDADRFAVRANQGRDLRALRTWRFIEAGTDVDRDDQVGRHRERGFERQHRPQTAVGKAPAIELERREIERKGARSVERVVQWQLHMWGRSMLRPYRGEQHPFPTVQVGRG